MRYSRIIGRVVSSGEDLLEHGHIVGRGLRVTWPVNDEVGHPGVLVASGTGPKEAPAGSPSSTLVVGAIAILG